jgi:hypothetical protein
MFVKIKHSAHSLKFQYKCNLLTHSSAVNKRFVIVEEFHFAIDFRVE